MALDIIADVSPPERLPFGNHFVMPAFRVKMAIGGNCLYREMVVPLWAEDAFHKLWKKHLVAFLSRGYAIQSFNGKWTINQHIQEHTDHKGVYTLTAVGQEKLDIAKGAGTLGLQDVKLDLRALPSELEAKLLDYQIEPARQLLRALACGLAEWGYSGAWDCSDLGTGKTYTSLAAALAFAMAINGQVFVICPISVIGCDPRSGGTGSGWRGAFAHFNAVPRGIYNYETLRTGNRDFVKWEHYIGEEGKKMKRLNWTLDPSRTVLIFDEAHKCFPWYTRVATEHGEFPIGIIVSLRLKLRVFTRNSLGQDELRSIVDWHANPMQPLVRVHHSYGHFDCTATHQVWTNAGWCNASELAPGSVLCALRDTIHATNTHVAEILRPAVRVSRERELDEYGDEIAAREYSWSSERQSAAEASAGVSLLRRDVPAAEQHGCVLQQKMRCSPSVDKRSGEGGEFAVGEAPRISPSAAVKRDRQEMLASHEGAQSDAESRYAGENEEITLGPDVSCERRQWENHESATGCSGRAWVADGVLHCGPNRDEAEFPESSEELQGGRCESRTQNGSRNRRQDPQAKEVEVLGPAKGSNFIVSRVDRVEVLERTGRQEPRGRAGDDCLYDIEVEGTHCYFADGILVHNCKKVGTQNQALAMAAMRQRFPTIFTSGTLGSDPTHMRATGRAVGLHKDGQWLEFLKKNGCWGNHPKGKDWKFIGGPRGQRILQHIHYTVFPSRGARIRIQDLGDRFPETQVIVEAYQTKDTQGIAKAFRDAEHAIERLKTQGDISEETGKKLRMNYYMDAWHASERAKVWGGLLEEMCEEEIEEGRSVAIFMGFTDTREELMRRLKTSCGIFGTQPLDHRNRWIGEFQADRERVIVCQIAAGGVGVSLHDINGKHPRTAIILPHNSAEVVTQALGRVHRSGGRSKSRQIIPFAAGTVEEEICSAVRRKMAQIDTLNDGDLYPPKKF